MSSALAVCHGNLVAAEPLHQIQGQIQRGVHTSAAVKAWSSVTINLASTALWDISAESVPPGSMRRGRLPSSRPVAATSPTPEQTLAMVAPRLRQRAATAHQWITLKHIVHADAGGRDEYDVGFADLGKGDGRSDMDWPVTADRASIRRRGGHVKLRRRLNSRGRSTAYRHAGKLPSDDGVEEKVSSRNTSGDLDHFGQVLPDGLITYVEWQICHLVASLFTSS